jgi:hypothetical protein
MVRNKSSMPFRRAREFEKRKLLRLSIASALAAGMVIAASADARTTKIQSCRAARHSADTRLPASVSTK